MPHELTRLLSSYRFLQQALVEHRGSMTDANIRDLTSELEDVFASLVDYSSPHKQVTLLQSTFLLSSMSDMVPDRAQAAKLLKKCLSNARRLAGPDAPALEPPMRDAPCETAATALLAPREARLLNSLSDRASICGRDYRYMFTNRANATFHGKTPDEMVGKPAIKFVGQRRFEEVSKPTLEKCFAGQSISFPISYSSGARTMTYSISCEPVRNDDGDVVAALCICRNISSYAIISDVLYEMPAGSLAD